MIDSHFVGELLPDEQLLWSGQPDPSVHFTLADLYLIPFSLMWCGFAIFWEYAVLAQVPRNPDNSAITPFFAVWGVPFVLVGLYLLVGRFGFKILQKRQTFYAVTDKRVLVLSDLGRRSLKSASLATIPVVDKSLRDDGSGSITFGQTNLVSNMYGNTGLGLFMRGRYAQPLAFYDIKEAGSVYNLIVSRQQQR